MQYKTKAGLVGTTAAFLLASLFSSSGCGKTEIEAMTINDINDKAKEAAYGPMTNKGYKDGVTYELTFDTIGSGYFAVIKYDADGKEPYDDKTIAINLPTEDATEDQVKSVVADSLSGVPKYEGVKPVATTPVATEPVYKVPTESEAESAIRSAVNRAISDSGFTGRYELKESWSEEAPDFCLKLYCGNSHLATYYFNYVTDYEPILSQKGSREKQILAINAELDGWTQSDLENEYYGFLRSQLENLKRLDRQRAIQRQQAIVRQKSCTRYYKEPCPVIKRCPPRGW